jgi:hypothetical protein
MGRWGAPDEDRPMKKVAVFGFFACVVMAGVLFALPVHVHPGNDPSRLASCGSVLHPRTDGADPACQGVVSEQKDAALAPAVGAGLLVLLVVVAVPSGKARRRTFARAAPGGPASRASAPSTVG